MTHGLDLSDPALYPVWTEENVRFNDLDPLNHVTNTAYGVYFETARLALNRRADLRLGDVGAQVVVAHTSLDFRGEVHYPNRLLLGIGVEKVGTTSWTVAGGLFVGDRCFTTHRAVMVSIDMATRRPVPLTPDARELLLTLALRT